MAQAATPAHTDVMFLFDTTGSMGGAITEAQAEIQEAMTQISASLPDAEFALSEVNDYDVVNNPGIFEYGIGEGFAPWSLKVPITSNQAAVSSELLKLFAEGGGDSPEAYGRGLFESDINSAVGWRPGARGLIVLVADDVPHDNELNQGIPSEFWVESPFDTGIDPGPDQTVGTPDDLDWQGGVLQRLINDGKPLEFVDYHGDPAYLPYWKVWAGSTGGSAFSAEFGSLGAQIVAAVKAGASATLPACPSGQIRDASEHCVTPPSNKFKIEPRVSCAGVCHVVLVKIVFDSAGNVIMESIEGGAHGSGAESSAVKKGHKKKAKPQFKKVNRAVKAGVNTLKLKLSRAAQKTLKKKREAAAEGPHRVHADRRHGEKPEPHVRREAARETQKIGAAPRRAPGGRQRVDFAPMPAVEKVCVIGAGSSGIVACQVLNARGIPFDCFEKGSAVGGNWRFENDNGMSSAYRSLHINTSRRVMAFETLPMPDHYPDYPDHFQMAAYFDEYVDHFGLREKIAFRTEVLSVEPRDGGWEVTVEDAEGKRETQQYRAVLVANGHHWDPRWPEPGFPGAEEFSGEQLHVHHYREADVLRGKRVLVLGIGNSATDVAVESSRIADATFLAMRRGAYVLPKYMNGKPIDEVATPLVSRLPMAVQRFFSMRMLGVAAGDMTAYGLPKPDHKLFEAHPTVSSELLPRLGHGDIAVKPNIERFLGGRTIRFIDGSEEEIDLVVYCTGYKMTFPFFDPSVFSAPDNRLPLYRRVASVEHQGLYLIGFIQPLGPIMPLAEAQANWVADLLDGRATLPGAAEMKRDVATEEEKMRKRFVASKRHTVEVDFHPYLREIRRERKRATQRV